MSWHLAVSVFSDNNIFKIYFLFFLHLADMVETEVGDVEGGGWGKPSMKSFYQLLIFGKLGFQQCLRQC